MSGVGGVGGSSQRRIAILPGGEAATRLITAARELSGITTIALYCEPQERALFVREADERVCLRSSATSSLQESASHSLERLEAALQCSQADTLWPGWGAAAVDPELAQRCAELGVSFVGPSAACLRRVADKPSLLQAAEKLGLAIPETHAPEIEPDEYTIHIPIACDAHGTVWVLGACVQTLRLHDGTLLHEAPAQLDPSLAERACTDAARLARGLGLHNVASVQLRYRPKTRELAFVDVLACLPSEHAITEALTGVDLVKLQLHIARQQRLVGAPPRAHGFACLAPLCAEPTPSSGDSEPGPNRLIRLEQFRLPTGPFVRVDTGYLQHDTVPADAQHPFAKLVTSGATRLEARRRMQRALVDTAVVLSHATTRKGQLVLLLESQPGAFEGDDASSAPQLDVRAAAAPANTRAEVALLYAAVEEYEAETAVDKHAFARSAARGRPIVSANVGCTVELSYAGHGYVLQIRRLDAERYHIATDDRGIELSVLSVGPRESRVWIAGRSHRVLSTCADSTRLIEVDGTLHSVHRASGHSVRAPAPAVVVAIEAQAGEHVQAGQCLVVLEAMKSYLRVVAPRGGRVGHIWVQPNTQVAAGRPLLVLESSERSQSAPSVPRLELSGLFKAADDRHPLHEMRRLVLGYDIDASALSAALGRPADALSLAERLLREDDVIEAFVDLLQLFRHPTSAARQADATPDHPGEHVSATEYFHTYLRDLSGQGQGLPPSFVDKLRGALLHYGVTDLERTGELHEALFRICKARERLDVQVAPLLSLLQRRIDAASHEQTQATERTRVLLDRLILLTQSQLPALHDAAREVRYLYFERALLDESRRLLLEQARAHLQVLSQAGLQASDRRAHVQALVRSPHPLLSLFSAELPTARSVVRRAMVSVLLARHYEVALEEVRVLDLTDDGLALPLATGSYESEAGRIQILVAQAELADLDSALQASARYVQQLWAAESEGHKVQLDIYCACPNAGSPVPEPWLAVADPATAPEVTARFIAEQLSAQRFAPQLSGVVIALAWPDRVQHISFLRTDGGYFEEQTALRGVHPMLARRLELWRFSRFDLQRLPSVEEIFLFRAVARDNPQDERFIALAEARDLTPVRDDSGKVVGLPHLERTLSEALTAIRFEQTCRPPKQRLYWNRIQLFVRQPLLLSDAEINGIVQRLAPATAGLGLEHIWVVGPMGDSTGAVRERILDLFNLGGGPTMVMRDKPSEPVEPLSGYAQKLVRLHRQGLTHPYEIIAMFTPSAGRSVTGFPPGEFIEHDLGKDDELVPVERAPGDNQANLVVGVMRTFTQQYPEGMARVAIYSDPSQEMGSLAEPECRRVIAALSLARRLRAPVEWFTLSAGAKIAMDSGTENMDWIALVLRRIIEFTQECGELNIIVHGINVGGQPYWNAEATMLMHTRGVLIMTEDSAMVLTGKRALDFSGGVSAEDNFGIGGYERVMGPNGQAQYYAQDLTEACRVLLQHYAHTYVAPGERMPRRARTTDPYDRSVLSAPHAEGYGFSHVGDLFNADKNPGRKQPFDMRSVLRAAIDQDHPPLERWADQRGGEVAIVWDAHLGGVPVCLLGIESHPLHRMGLTPADGPDHYTPGTLFPVASKKIARAINAASDNRPLVVLANLTGFDGSPESMRQLQLEYGAEIGRAIVNFRGSIVFCVISRYHGGAFVVFSAKLNDNMEVAALEGSYASVIGGAPAAAVVFAREVDRRTRKNAELTALEADIARAPARERALLKARYDRLFNAIHAQTLGQVAHEFDQVHTIDRARALGSVHQIIAPERLRPYLIDAVERGIRRAISHA